MSTTAAPSTKNGKSNASPAPADGSEGPAKSRSAGAKPAFMGRPRVDATGDDKRQHPRLRATRRVNYTVAGKPRWAFTKDLGPYGLFLRASEAFKKGDVLDLTIEVTGKEPLPVRGTVVRVETRGTDKGYGIEFDANDVERRAAIASLVLNELETRVNANLKVRATNVRALEELAEIAVSRGKLTAAIDCYQRILKVEPEHAMAHGRIAEHLVDQARARNDSSPYEEAIEHLERSGLPERSEPWKKFLVESKRAIEELARAEAEERERQQKAAEAERRELVKRAKDAEETLREALAAVDAEKKKVEQRAKKLTVAEDAVAEREQALEDSHRALEERAEQERAELKRLTDAHEAAAEEEKKALANARRKLKREQAETEAALADREAATRRAQAAAETALEKVSEQRAKLEADQAK
ncbi:MAG TPA: PilZ domain-containing protein, partial [Myxococcota bacterium]|nr:PilZ domain-containing protein [Myxococcota bacterium]